MSTISNDETQLKLFERNSDKRLCASNRWVTLASAIPWATLREECEPELRKDFRALFAACLVEAQYGLSEDETALMILESPYLQYFCGLKGYNGATSPLDASEIRRFSERLNTDVLQRIRALVSALRP